MLNPLVSDLYSQYVSFVNDFLENHLEIKNILCISQPPELQSLINWNKTKVTHNNWVLSENQDSQEVELILINNLSELVENNLHEDEIVQMIRKLPKSKYILICSYFNNSKPTHGLYLALDPVNWLVIPRLLSQRETSHLEIIQLITSDFPLIVREIFQRINRGMLIVDFSSDSLVKEKSCQVDAIYQTSLDVSLKQPLESNRFIDLLLMNNSTEDNFSEIEMNLKPNCLLKITQINQNLLTYLLQSNYQMITRSQETVVLMKGYVPSKLEIVIPTTPKDFPILKQCINSIRTYLPEAGDIYLIGKDLPFIDSEVKIIDERDFPFSIEDVKSYTGDGVHGWYFQQLLKLYAYQKIPTNNNLDTVDRDLLIVDSDLVYQRETKYYDVDGKVFLGVSTTENHQPYYQHMNRTFGLTKQYSEYSGVVHHMLFRREINQALIKSDTWKNMLSNLDPNSLKNSGMSEYECMFNYALTKYQNLVTLRHLSWLDSRFYDYSDDTYSFICFHSWYCRRKN